MLLCKMIEFERELILPKSYFFIGLKWSLALFRKMNKHSVLTIISPIRLKAKMKIEVSLFGGEIICGKPPGDFLGGGQRNNMGRNISFSRVYMPY